MRKICYVVTVPGTIRAFFVSQLNYLNENGFDVTVICSSGNELKELLDEKIRIITVDIPRGISLLKTVNAIKRLYHIFKKYNFDIVQYSTSNATFCASIAAKYAKIKSRNYHLMGLRYLSVHGIGKKILKLVEKISCELSTSIECVSKSNLELGINDKIFKRNKAVVVWNGSTGGVDLKRFDVDKRSEYRNEIRSNYGLHDDFIFGFVGRITRDKGVNEILEAFLQMETSKLMMIGSAEGTQTLNQELYRQSLSNPNIIYTGKVPDVEKYFATIDVLLLPSYREGFGNVIIEAAAMGTPAIVSDIPGPIDAIQSGVTALVIECQSVQSLIEKMNKIQLLDYVEMGRRASEFAKQKFDSELLCEKILERKKGLLG
ncbi:MAG: glycosyltransferase family 4 protein [Hespellia sp.]|nr:glycosyltransferase family 4 protein [Hespellia sp.]